MAPRPAGTGLEDLGPAQLRIRDDVVRRIHRPDVQVLITTTDQSTPTPRSPDQVFVYSDDSMTVQSLGTPLVLTVICADATVWPSINATMERAGFSPFGPRSSIGSQAYCSISRAWLVVPVNPGATRAIDMIGKAVLGWNVAPVA
jgi:hypothetical protein